MTDPDTDADAEHSDSDPLEDEWEDESVPHIDPKPVDADDDPGGSGDDAEPDTEDTSSGGGIAGVADAILAGGVVVGSTVLGTRIFPKSEKLWLGVAKLGLKKTKKTTGADMIGFLSNEGGQLEPAPMKVKQRDEDNSRYWATVENDVEYDLGPQGVSREYIGNVPVGFFVEDPPREVSMLEARARDAVDLGQHQPVVDGKVTLHEHVWQPAENMDAGGRGGKGGAMPDGGHSQAGMEEVFDREVEIDADDIPNDSILDLSSESGNGARVSWNRVNDILHEKPANEKMVMQEQRGELAGASGNQDKIQRIAIWAMGFIVLTVFGLLFGPSIINAVFGGGTIGGLGGALPSIGG